ncbi:MAG TPA: sigma-70 family RNA polymerase sigma factor [Ktedonobacteraceae bacterium]|jgi:RNA polymerase sigma factor (sigma-70 family)|nr:sigma-70 family RNA polymerase sigma factor [Ktedonobacteraceae bacterium]
MEALPLLVIAAQNGDLDAFARIVRRFQGMAFTLAYAMLEDAQLAEDVAQEAFIEAYLNLPKLREPAAFPGWFRRIVFKQGDRVVRGKHITTVPLEPAMPFDIALEHLNPAHLAEHSEMQDFVRGAIETLPEGERIVTLLFYAGDYTLKDISVFLEIPITTVKKRLYDARKRLKERLMDEVRDTLHGQQTGSSRHYPDKILLFINIRRGDFDAVKAQIERDPTLVTMKMGWDVTATLRYQIVIPGGNTALHATAERGNVSIAELLIDYGADVNATTRSGLTPMYNAILGHHTGMVQLLLARGANVNATIANGLAPLHLAAMKGYSDIAALLPDNRAQVNAQSRAGRTPLHWAAINGHGAIVQLLLEKGANLEARDELGRTPLDWALARGQREVALMLQQYSHAGKELS